MSSLTPVGISRRLQLQLRKPPIRLIRPIRPILLGSARPQQAGCILKTDQLFLFFGDFAKAQL